MAEKLTGGQAWQEVKEASKDALTSTGLAVAAVFFGKITATYLGYDVDLETGNITEVDNPAARMLSLFPFIGVGAYLTFGAAYMSLTGYGSTLGHLVNAISGRRVYTPSPSES